MLSTMRHAILLDPYILSWIESFITGRTPVVHVDNGQSTFLNVLCGVPQGSVIGPLHSSGVSPVYCWSSQDCTSVWHDHLAISVLPLLVLWLRITVDDCSWPSHPSIAERKTELHSIEHTANGAADFTVFILHVYVSLWRWKYWSVRQTKPALLASGRTLI